MRRAFEAHASIASLSNRWLGIIASKGNIDNLLERFAIVRSEFKIAKRVLEVHAERLATPVHGSRNEVLAFDVGRQFEPCLVISRRLRECDVILSKVTCLLAHHERQSLQAPPGQRP